MCVSSCQIGLGQSNSPFHARVPPPPCGSIASSSQLSERINFVDHRSGSSLNPKTLFLFHLACLYRIVAFLLSTLFGLGFVMASTKPSTGSFGLRLRLRIIAAIATTVVILALALGLGLGLGLKHHRHIAASQASPSTRSLPFLTPQTSNNFIVGSIVGQSPQDRKYNFTLALANGAPDGVNKTMLVVNGTSLCPCRHRTGAVPFGFGMV